MFSYSIPSQERLRNNLFCVEWNVNLNSVNLVLLAVIQAPA